MNLQKITPLILRFSLAAAYLSAVADRFGLWGQPGSEGVAWGDFAHFVSYTKVLNPYFPDFVISPLAWIATILEVLLGVFLILNIRIKETALVSAALLGIFFLSMAINLGLKAPLDYSVLTACGASLALALTAQPRR